jgi:hypothetical protein
MLSYEEVIAIVQQALVPLGWTPLTGHTAEATKTYETAVGPKEANLYISRGDEYNRTLYGDYQSEGRNVLACGTLIPVDASAEFVAALAAKWAAQAEADVDQSYARSLFLKWG